MFKDIDVLRLLNGKPIKITSKIEFRQPILNEVVEFGERKYYQILSNLTAIPSDMKSLLWDSGIDWMELPDIELFYSLTKEMNSEESSIFFPNINFTKFILIKNDNNEVLMYNKEEDIRIDNFVYKKMQDCLCKSHGIKKKVEYAGNKYTKKVLIDEDRQNRELNKNKEFKSNLFGLVSGMVNYSGFKYNYDTVWNLTMFQFMDAVNRAKIIDSTTHLLNGVYAGTVDAKKIKSNKFDWTREIKEE